MNAPHTPAGLDALRFGSGHTVRRIEDPTLVAGQGRYSDDLQREGLAHLPLGGRGASAVVHQRLDAAAAHRRQQDLL